MMYDVDPHSLDVAQCRALLLEIVLRAAYDWVMYRNHRRLLLKKNAQEAYAWLFVEGPGHPDWIEREKEGWHLFSFLAICDALDLNPAAVRKSVRKLTPQRIQARGRPPTRRRPQFANSEIESVGTSGMSLADRHSIQDGGELLSLE